MGIVLLSFLLFMASSVSGLYIDNENDNVRVMYARQLGLLDGLLGDGDMGGNTAISSGTTIANSNGLGGTAIASSTNAANSNPLGLGLYRRDLPGLSTKNVVNGLVQQSFNHILSKSASLPTASAISSFPSAASQQLPNISRSSPGAGTAQATSQAFKI